MPMTDFSVQWAATFKHFHFESKNELTLHSSTTAPKGLALTVLLVYLVEGDGKQEIYLLLLKCHWETREVVKSSETFSFI